MPFINMGAFTDIFPEDVRQDLHAKAERPNCPDDIKAIDCLLNGDHPAQRHWRIHFDAWLEFCVATGGMDADRKSRLRNLKDFHAWQGVLNELRIPYFLDRVHGFVITYTHGWGADVAAERASELINVEIKTPGIEPVVSPRTKAGRHLGKDKLSIVQNLQRADKQFQRGAMNVLAIAGHNMERCPVRDGLYVTEALYGQEKLAFSFNPNTGTVSIGQARSVFVRDGKLQHNRFTRIGAVLVFNDDYHVSTRKQCRASHQYHCTVYHNPYAETPISADFFWGTKQLLFDKDGHSYWQWPRGTTYTFRGY